MFRCLWIFILIFTFSSCEVIDNLNPNVVAIVGDKKIYLDRIKERIRKENPDIKITKPLIMFYINERIKEIILEEEFKKLGMKITEEDRKKYPLLVQLDEDQLKKVIIFDKVKKFVVRKITYPSDEECFRFYKKHIKEFDHTEKVKLRYVVLEDVDECEKVFKLLKKTKNFSYVLSKLGLDFTFKGVIKVSNIPDDVKAQIDYTKPNSFWLVNVKDRCYVIECLKFYKNEPLPYREVKKKIKEMLISERQSRLFDLWLKKQMEKRKIKIYYEKIK